MDQISKHDWKIFKEHHDVMRERFMNNALSKISKLIREGGKSNIGMFDEIAKVVKKSRKKDSRLFADYSRNTAILSILGWNDEGLITEAEIQKYSRDLQSFLGLYKKVTN